MPRRQHLVQELSDNACHRGRQRERATGATEGGRGRDDAEQHSRPSDERVVRAVDEGKGRWLPAPCPGAPGQWAPWMRQMAQEWDARVAEGGRGCASLSNTIVPLMNGSSEGGRERGNGVTQVEGTTRGAGEAPTMNGASELRGETEGATTTALPRQRAPWRKHGRGSSSTVGRAHGDMVGLGEGTTQA